MSLANVAAVIQRCEFWSEHWIPRVGLMILVSKVYRPLLCDIPSDFELVAELEDICEQLLGKPYLDMFSP